MGYHVERIELEPQQVAVVQGEVPHDGVAGFLGGAFGEVMGTLGAQGLQPAGPPLARYEIIDGGFRIEAGFPVDGELRPMGRVQVAQLPAGPTLTVLHRGAYDQVAAAYQAAEAWLVEHDWEAAAPPWEAYLDGPEVPQPRTIVHVPCRPK
ncbi:MAG: GyrI-like domain-containing protein [Candidatus Nanopelagicales bacterium]|jgi:effector-binding domain-containing protein|nr:GyrI-like domain-containing protein [Candidatus Nanopelagicales bacterium]